MSNNCPLNVYKYFYKYVYKCGTGGAVCLMSVKQLSNPNN